MNATNDGAFPEDREREANEFAKRITSGIRKFQARFPVRNPAANAQGAPVSPLAERLAKLEAQRLAVEENARAIHRLLAGGEF